MSAPAEVLEFLTRYGLFPEGAALVAEPLSGGVSSQIWHVHDDRRHAVVKTPLEELRVSGGWRAPLSRSATEADWLHTVGRLVPGACPEVLAYDGSRHLLALSYLDPARHRVWKDDLLRGEVDLAFAASVGARLGAVHRVTSQRPEIAERFATDDLFEALRIEPYFRTLVRRHPELADAIDALIDETLTVRTALVHGDASPKNILVGPDGPVILDAETARWGDPAFDVAFCLNHLLLKSLLPGAPRDALVDAAHLLLAGYLDHVDTDARAALEARVVRLLPLLLLARVDGRSPVEYLDQPATEVVRAFSRRRIRTPVEQLFELTAAWKVALA
ncbi:phosphotransferase [Marmoricola sp. RAF53]|uniref:phosphotransferase n=1 Tax=Marmoricola sp. RAF53 TaxID=3233059 RepID=UPI003F98299F